MKRSEAILAIAECLIEPHNEDVEKEASYILNKLEKFGLSPRTYIPSGCMHDVWEDCNCQETYEFGWEKE